MNAVLVKFKVENFRSITESGWIDTESLTCLVGTNESGKTNLLLALWKLNPANKEPITPLVDYPRKSYHLYNTTKGEEIFITAHFKVAEEVADQISLITGWHSSLHRDVFVSRKYNGSYVYSFVNDKLPYLLGEVIVGIIDKLIEKFQESSLQEKESEEDLTTILEFAQSLKKGFGVSKSYLQENIVGLKNDINSFLQNKYKRKTNINLFFTENILEELDKIIDAFNEKGLSMNKDVEKLIEKNIPTFVYYSDYGNLDSEIYLPHVIDNFNRKDLGDKERAKVRSLKVLFDFVKLSPEQILELGKEATPVKVMEYTTDPYGNKKLTKDEIQKVTESNIEEESIKKKERGILLQSASTTLTKDFAAWWKQGKYIFDFQADGNHFRIWVSDNMRPEKIELEGRSKGLQWFFSFFLVFLVESKDSHSNCILLLDEPGISLHPVAQMDLIAFFNSLSKENQLLYTTHSPFLVDTNNLNGVHAMFVGENGESIVSSDLRANKKISEKSIYPIHAAIGITVSETMLMGCQPILVEGVSDQIYMQLIKKYIVSLGEYKNEKEIVFIPTGGVKGMSPVIKLLLGKEDNLPYVILDSDKPGKDMLKQLQSNLYANDKEKLISISEFTGEGDYEVEDFMSSEELARLFSKQYRGDEEEFDYIYNKKLPIVNQMAGFAKQNGYELSDGWKVVLAKDFQKNFDRILPKLDASVKQRWINLFKKITASSPN